MTELCLHMSVLSLILGIVQASSSSYHHVQVGGLTDPVTTSDLPSESFQNLRFYVTSHSPQNLYRPHYHQYSKGYKPSTYAPPKTSIYKLESPKPNNSYKPSPGLSYSPFSRMPQQQYSFPQPTYNQPKVSYKRPSYPQAKLLHFKPSYNHIKLIKPDASPNTVVYNYTPSQLAIKTQTEHRKPTKALSKEDYSFHPIINNLETERYIPAMTLSEEDYSVFPFTYQQKKDEKITTVEKVKEEPRSRKYEDDNMETVNRTDHAKASPEGDYSAYPYPYQQTHSKNVYSEVDLKKREKATEALPEEKTKEEKRSGKVLIKTEKYISGQSDNDDKDLVTKPTPTKPSSGGDSSSDSFPHQQDKKIKKVNNSKNYFIELFEKFQSYNLGAEELKKEINSGKDIERNQTTHHSEDMFSNQVPIKVLSEEDNYPNQHKNITSMVNLKKTTETAIVEELKLKSKTDKVKIGDENYFKKLLLKFKSSNLQNKESVKEESRKAKILAREPKGSNLNSVGSVASTTLLPHFVPIIAEQLSTIPTTTNAPIVTTTTLATASSSSSTIRRPVISLFHDLSPSTSAIATDPVTPPGDFGQTILDKIRTVTLTMESILESDGDITVKTNEVENSNIERKDEKDTENDLMLGINNTGDREETTKHQKQKEVRQLKTNTFNTGSSFACFSSAECKMLVQKYQSK